MWIVRDLELKPARMDFTSSGRGFRDVVEVAAEGTTLCNAIDLADWSEPSVQVTVCECCGYPRCQPGGWVTLRRAGDLVALIPAFAQMESGEWERHEYEPPAFMWKPGVPLLSVEAFAKLRTVAAEVPDPTTLPPMTGRELLRCVQWTAPMRVLGLFPDALALRQELVLAVSEGEVADAARSLGELFEQVGRAPEVRLAGTGPAVPITLHLEGKGFPEWIPAVRVEGEGLRLAPAPGLVAAKAG